MTDQLKSYCSELLRMLTGLRVCNVEEDRDGYFLTAGRCFGYIDCLRDSASVTGEVATRMRDLVASACANSWRGAIPDALNAGPCIPFHIAGDRRRAAEQPPVQDAEPEPQKPIRPSWLDGGLEALEMVKEDMTAAEPVAVLAGARPTRSKVVRSPSGGWMTVPVKPQAQDSASEKSEPVPAPAPRRGLRLLCLLVPSRTGGTRSLPVHTLRPVPPRVCGQGRWNLASETGFHLRETQATAPSPEVLERYSRLGQSNALRSGPRAVSRAGGQL